MTILMTAFIWFAVSIVNSDGSNLSLFESKVVNGSAQDDDSVLTYMVTILEKGVTYSIVGMGTFYNRKLVLTSQKCAESIHGNENNFKVRGGLTVGHRSFKISNAYYENYGSPQKTAAYGILQLKNEANIFLQVENPITLNKFNFDDCMSNIKLSSGGWGKNSENELVLQSLSLEVIPRQNCLKIFESKQMTRSIETDEICVFAPNGGYFSQHDSGAPLYMSSTELVGIANTLALGEGEISIFTLLGDKREEIKKFVEALEKYSKESSSLSLRPTSDRFFIDPSISTSRKLSNTKESSSTPYIESAVPESNPLHDTLSVFTTSPSPFIPMVSGNNLKPIKVTKYLPAHRATPKITLPSDSSCGTLKSFKALTIKNKHPTSSSDSTSSTVSSSSKTFTHSSKSSQPFTARNLQRLFRSRSSNFSSDS